MKNIKYLALGMILALFFVTTANAGKISNHEQLPQTPELTWKIIDASLRTISQNLADKEHRLAINPARNLVTAIRDLQNFESLIKHRKNLQKPDLAQALTLASRMANALKKNKTKVANTALKELKNVLKK